MRWSIAAGAALLGLLCAAPTARAEEGWTWPVRGRVLTAYSNDNARPYADGMHRGIDIGADAGSQVVAARAGTVTFAGPLGSSGNVVSVRSEDGRHVTTYLHLGAVSVRRDARVTMGARLGEVGTTGRRSTPEPHLHFGVRLADADDRYVDPLSLLPALGAAEVAPAAPAPVPVAAPMRAQEAPAAGLPVKAHSPAVVPRAIGQGFMARPRGTVMPGPAATRSIRPVAVPGVGRRSPGRMRTPEPAPAGLRAPASGRVRHPEAAPAPAELPQATGDRARALVWAGLGVVALVLFGGTLMRANAAVNRRVVALVATARRLGPSPAWFWALRHPKPSTDR